MWILYPFHKLIYFLKTVGKGMFTQRVENTDLANLSYYPGQNTLKWIS